MTRKKRLLLNGDIVGVIVTVAVFLIPFYFMLVNSLKSQSRRDNSPLPSPANCILKTM